MGASGHWSPAACPNSTFFTAASQFSSGRGAHHSPGLDYAWLSSKSSLTLSPSRLSRLRLSFSSTLSKAGPPVSSIHLLSFPRPSPVPLRLYSTSARPIYILLQRRLDFFLLTYLSLYLTPRLYILQRLAQSALSSRPLTASFNYRVSHLTPPSRQQFNSPGLDIKPTRDICQQSLVSIASSVRRLNLFLLVCAAPSPHQHPLV